MWIWKHVWLILLKAVPVVKSVPADRSNQTFWLICPATAITLHKIPWISSHKTTLTHCHILQWEVRCFALYAVAFCHQTCWWSAQTKGLILGLSDYNSWYLMALGEVKALHCISCDACWWIPNCSRCEFSVTTLTNCISWYFSSLTVYALYPLLHLCNSKPSIFSVLKFFQVPPR